jgi:hypothetical protein
VTTGRPDPDSMAPLPERYVPPARRLRPGTLLVIAIAGVLLLVGFGYGVDSLFDSGAPRANSAPRKGAIPPWRSPTPVPTPTPTPTPSATPTTPRPATSEFAKIVDICALLPKSTVARLVGKAKDEPDYSDPTWSCTRDHDYDEEEREVDLGVTLSSVTSGGTRAASEDFVERQQEARTGGKHDFELFDSTFGPVIELPGIGDEAFYQYKIEKQIFETGVGIVVTRVKNAIIEVQYGGYTSSGNWKTKKMSEATTRSGAVEIARGVVKSLAKCAACRS